jgi:hypothetical protein
MAWRSFWSPDRVFVLDRWGAMTRGWEQRP